jgi:phage shock protein C
MSRPRYRYSLARQDAKIAGVCSALGNRMGIDPTFVRIGFVAAAFFISWKVALVLYAGLGIWMTLQRKREVDGRSEFERMGDVSTRRPSVHAMRTELDETDRRLMAIDHHINSQNEELAREIEALRQEEK